MKRKEKIFCQSQCKKYNRQQRILANYKAFSIREKKSKEKITSIENEKLVSDNTEVANCLKNFLSNIVKNLEIPISMKYRIIFTKKLRVQP